MSYIDRYAKIILIIMVCRLINENVLFSNSEDTIRKNNLKNNLWDFQSPMSINTYNC
jgi:hypothetical protein